MSKLAEEIAEDLLLSTGLKKEHYQPAAWSKMVNAKAALIDEKLSGVRLSVEQAYIETLSTPHQEAWESLKVD